MPEIVEKGKGALTHKIGPLPLWGWVVAGAAAVFVVKKVGGAKGGGSAGGTGISIPTLSPGGASTSGSDFVAASPNQNVSGGMDTVSGGTAPWWAQPPKWWTDGVAAVPLYGQPSSNGSAGNGMNGSGIKPPPNVPPPAPDVSWWTRLTNPQGSLPSGAAVTNIGGTTYSLSDAALTRAAIPGATAPAAPVPSSRFENI